MNYCIIKVRSVPFLSIFNLSIKSNFVLKDVCIFTSLHPHIVELERRMHLQMASTKFSSFACRFDTVGPTPSGPIFTTFLSQITSEIGVSFMMLTGTGVELGEFQK